MKINCKGKNMETKEVVGFFTKEIPTNITIKNNSTAVLK